MGRLDMDALGEANPKANWNAQNYALDQLTPSLEAMTITKTEKMTAEENHPLEYGKERDPDQQYDILIRKYTYPRNPLRYGQKFDETLEDIFLSQEQTTSADWICPLQYSCHTIVHLPRGPLGTSSEAVLKVKLKLSCGATQTLEQAFAQFCNIIFKMKGHGMDLLANLSEAKLFGLEPDSRSTLAPIWHSSFLLCAILQERVLRKLATSMASNPEHITDWVVTPCVMLSGRGAFHYASAGAKSLIGQIGPDLMKQLGYLNMDRDSVWASIAATGVLAGIGFIETTLLVLQIKSIRETTDRSSKSFQSLHWKTKMRAFSESVKIVIDDLHAINSSRNIDPLKQTELWMNLYNLTAGASDAFTMNSEAIKIYTKSCEEYNEHLKKNLLGGVVNLAFCGILTAFSASTLNVTINGALTMPAMPALAILLGLPTTSASVILLSSLSIVVGVSGVFFLGLGLYSWIKKRAAQKKVDGFEKVQELIAEIWQVAVDTYAHLGMLRHVGPNQPGLNSPAAQRDYQEFMTKFHERNGKRPGLNDYTEQGLLDFLKSSLDDLEGAKTDLDKLIESPGLTA